MKLQGPMIRFAQIIIRHVCEVINTPVVGMQLAGSDGGGNRSGLK